MTLCPPTVRRLTGLRVWLDDANAGVGAIDLFSSLATREKSMCLRRVLGETNRGSRRTDAATGLSGALAWLDEIQGRVTVEVAVVDEERSNDA